MGFPDDMRAAVVDSGYQTTHYSVYCRSAAKHGVHSSVGLYHQSLLTLLQYGVVTETNCPDTHHWNLGLQLRLKKYQCNVCPSKPILVACLYSATVSHTGFVWKIYLWNGQHCHWKLQQPLKRHALDILWKEIYHLALIITIPFLWCTS